MEEPDTTRREKPGSAGCSPDLAHAAIQACDLLVSATETLQLLQHAIRMKAPWCGEYSDRSLRRLLRTQSEELLSLVAALTALESCGRSCASLRLHALPDAAPLPVRDRSRLARTVPILTRACWRVSECVAEFRLAAAAATAPEPVTGLPHWLHKQDLLNSLKSIRMGARSVGDGLGDLIVITRACEEASRWTAISLRQRPR